MTNEPVKLTEAELGQLSKLTEEFRQLTVAVGQLGLQKFDIELREKMAKDKLSSLHTQQQEWNKSITDKYGVGTLNLQDGTFTKDVT